MSQKCFSRIKGRMSTDETIRDDITELKDKLERFKNILKKKTDIQEQAIEKIKSLEVENRTLKQQVGNSMKCKKMCQPTKQ